MTHEKATWHEHDSGVVARYEAARRAGERPALAEFAPEPDDANHADTIEELVRVELQFSWQAWRRGARGDATVQTPPAVERFVDDFPCLGEVPRLVRLLAEEYRLRHEVGDRPPVETYAARYPDLEHDGEDLVSILARTEPATVRLDASGEGWSPPPIDSGVPLEIVGEYRIRSELGRGTFARVYRGWDERLQRDVAVKLLRADYSEEPTIVARVYREARSAAQLRHPGIVPVYEVGEQDGRPYIVTELVSGGSLAERMKEPVDPERAALWVERVAEALHYAHQYGVVHRDVKPANVLMRSDTEPVVSDFGLALQASSDVTLTRDGDILGTPAYMSPEQAQGESKVDGRSDVYSLGVMLYHMLTGRLPFTGNVNKLIHSVIHDEPPRPRRHRAEIPIDLETVCLKAMAKDVGHRYRSAGELAEDLRRYRDRMPVLARRPGVVARTTLWCRRNPSHAATIALAAVVIVAVSAFSFIRLLDDRERIRDQRDKANANLYKALIGDTRWEMMARETGWWWAAVDNLQRASELDVPGRDIAELRRHALQLVGMTEPSFRVIDEWQAARHRLLTIVTSPDRRLVATGSAAGVVSLWETVTGRRLGTWQTHTGDDPRVAGLVFSADGSELASVGYDGVLVIRRVPGGRVRASEPVGEPLHSVAAGGGALAVGSRDGRVHLFERWDVSRKRSFESHRAQVNDVRFSVDGSRLVTAGEDSRICVIDVASGLELASHAQADAMNTACFVGARQDRVVAAMNTNFQHFYLTIAGGGSPARATGGRIHTQAIRRVVSDGRGRVYTASWDGQVLLWAGNRYLAVASREQGLPGVTSLDLLDDGMITAHVDGRVRRWELIESPYRATPARSHDFAFLTPDLLVGDGRITEIDATLATTDRRHTPPDVTVVAGHPERSIYVLGDADGRIGIGTMRPGQPVERIEAHDGPVRALAASPAGDAFASGGQDGRVRTWSWDGTHRDDLAVDVGPLLRLSWSGDRLLAFGESACAVLRPGGGESVVVETGGERPVSAELVGELTAVGTEAGTVVIRDASGAVTRVLDGHAAAVTLILDLPEADRLVSVSSAGVMIVWDRAAWREEARFDVPKSLRSLTADLDGQWLVGMHSGGAGIWDLDARTHVATMALRAISAAFVGEGTVWVMGTNAGSVIGASVPTLEQFIASRATGQASTGAIPVFDLAATLVEGGHEEIMWSVAVSPDGRRFATSGHDTTVKLWKRDGSLERTLRDLQRQPLVRAPIWCVAFSADSELVASGQADVVVWDADTGELLHRFPGHELLVLSVGFHPERPWLVSTSHDGTVRLWDVEAGGAGRIVHAGRTGALGSDFDGGAWLAVGCGDGRIRLWSTASLEEGERIEPTLTLEAHGKPAWAVAFHPTEPWLATAGEDGRCVIWEVGTWRRLAVLETETEMLRNLAWSPDGRRLAAGCYSHQSVLWDIAALRGFLGRMGLDW